MTDAYQTVYERSLSDPDGFWRDAAKNITWDRPPEEVLDRSNPPFFRWFPGGVLNTCFNAVDRHIATGRGDQPSLVWESPVTATARTYTYRDLQGQVSRFAGGLVRLGVGKGDRVVIYMPMVPEAVIAMLACARIGAVHSVVFGGFAPHELAVRIRDAAPRAIITANCGIEVNRIIPYKPLLDEAIAESGHTPGCCIMLDRPHWAADYTRGRDISWNEAIDAEPAPCVSVAATDPLYILYTSGTTGIPKGVVRDNGGHAVALLWSMQNIYGAHPGDVYWAASDIGWVVGHSYIVYAPLFHGCTSIIYEGKSVGTPDAGSFWRVIDRHHVNVLFTAPTAFRAIRREDPNGDHISRYNFSSLRTLFLAGERCDPDTLRWAEEHLGVPVIDHWWQTETGWAIGANPIGVHAYPVRPGSCTRPMPGYDIRVLDDGGREVPQGTTGNLVVRLPLPPGCLATLWKNDRDFLRTYTTVYPGYYHTADAGFVDDDGYLWVMGRTDDIINVAGHRLSTGAMEEVLASHPAVAECAVTGVHDTIKAEVPLGFVVTKSGTAITDENLARDLVGMVRSRIGPIASFKDVVRVRRLPKTRSGKILRGTMKKIADGAEYRVPATIDDPAILDEIREALEGIGYPHR